MLNSKTLLLTGGTGHFGQKFTEWILQNYPRIREIVIFSKDTTKQEKMKARFPDAPLRFLSGDMADKKAVEYACQGVDVIVHTAAFRIVPEAETAPWQAIQTNVLGAQNLIEAAVAQQVKQIVALSTDMASLANNVYGATKMLADKLFIAAHRTHPALKTTVVRLGNIFGSVGTVVPFFIRKAREEGILPVTDPRMSRFMATPEACVRMVADILRIGKGGEIVVPKIKSYNILTVAKAIAPQAEIRIIGLRPGEKLYEEMITRYDSFFTIEAENYYIIVPPYADKASYCRHFSAQTVPVGFEFHSENNPAKITVEEMKAMIRTFYPGK